MPAVLYQHTKTATARGYYEGVADEDTDDANDYGVLENQASIQIKDIANQQTTDGTSVTGSVYISDQSEMVDDFDVALTDFQG